MKTRPDTENLNVGIGREKKQRKKINKSDGDVNENGTGKDTSVKESSPMKKKWRDKSQQNSPAQVFPSSSYYETTATQVSAIRSRITQIGDFRPFPCEICDKAFKTNQHLVRHNLIHTGERPFSCSYCDKTFNQNIKLSEHERIHTGDRPYPCPICAKRFISSAQRLRHLRTHPGQVKPHDCPYCSKEFVTKNALTSHLVIHEKTGAFHCVLCDKYFHIKSSLINHEKTQRHVKKSQSNLIMDKKEGKQEIRVPINSTTPNRESNTQNIGKSMDKQPKEASIKTTSMKQESTNENLIESLDKKSKPYECRTCHKCFSSKFELKNHKLQKKHGLRNKSKESHGESSLSAQQQPTAETTPITSTPIKEEPRDETYITTPPEKELKSKKKYNCGGCTIVFIQREIERTSEKKRS